MDKQTKQKITRKINEMVRVHELFSPIDEAAMSYTHSVDIHASGLGFHHNYVHGEETAERCAKILRFALIKELTEED